MMQASRVSMYARSMFQVSRRRSVERFTWFCPVRVPRAPKSACGDTLADGAGT